MELLDCPPRGMFRGGPQAITAQNTAVLTEGIVVQSAILVFIRPLSGGNIERYVPV